MQALPSDLATACTPLSPSVPPADQLAQALVLGGVASVMWSADHEISYATPAFCEMLGVTTSELNHDSFLACVHPADRKHVARTQADLLTTGGSYEYQFRIIRPNGSVRWLLARGGTIVDADGRVTGFAGVKLDITAQKDAEMAAAATDLELRRKSEQLWAILDSMPQIAWSTLPDGFHDFYNQRWYDFTGVAPGSTDGEGWSELFHPDDQDQAWAAWRHSLATGAPYEVEYRLRHRDGTYRWTLGRALPIRNADGEIERWFGTCTDIERLKAAEDQLSLIAGELSHRIKNIFAVIGSLMHLAAQTEPVAKPFVARMRSRLAALAIAHDYIRGASVSEPTSLKLMLTELVQPYQEEVGQRVAVVGDDVAVGPGAATAFALVIHELATNSTKYGALSEVGGDVAVTCTTGDKVFVIEWTERGGPTIAGPAEETGFGTGLAQRAVGAQLKAQLDYRWLSQGLAVSISAPLANLAR